MKREQHIACYTGVLGGEHDHERLSVEGVGSTGLTAVIVGVALHHRHHLLPADTDQCLQSAKLKITEFVQNKSWFAKKKSLILVFLLKTSSVGI